jgi:hypothetical protein
MCRGIALFLMIAIGTSGCGGRKQPPPPPSPRQLAPGEAPTGDTVNRGTYRATTPQEVKQAVEKIQEDEYKRDDKLLEQAK